MTESMLEAYEKAKEQEAFSAFLTYYGIQVGVGSPPGDDHMIVWNAGSTDRSIEVSLEQGPKEFLEEIDDRISEVRDDQCGEGAEPSVSTVIGPYLPD